MRAAATIALALSLAAPAEADTLIVGNKGENSVSFVDLGSGRELRRLETGPMPHEVALSPDGRTAALVEYGGNGILLFDVARGERIERIDLGANRRPHGLVWLGDGRLVATAEGSDTIVAVRAAPRGDGDRVRAFPTGAQGSHMVVVSPDNRTAFVANMRSASVSVIDLGGRGPTRTIAEAGREPEGIALSPDGARLWVADRAGPVRVFDTRTLRQLGEVRAGETPIRVLISPDGREAVVSNFASGDLTVIDVGTLRVRRTIPVGGEGMDQVTMLFSPDGRRLYVAETAVDRIAEIEWPSGRVLGRLPAGRNGDGLGISAVTMAGARTIVAPPEAPAR